MKDTNKEIFENPEHRDKIKRHLNSTDELLCAAMVLNKSDEYIRLVNPEYKGSGSTGKDLGIRAKTGWYAIFKIIIGNKPLIFSTRPGATIHGTLAHHLERYNRDHLGQLSRNENAFGNYIAKNCILTIKDFVDHGGTIEMLEENPDKETNKENEKYLIRDLMLEHRVHGQNNRIWNQRQG